MNKSTNSQKKNEIRSDKVRKLIERLPKSLIYWSCIIIVIIVIMMLSALFLLPYPYSNGEKIISHIIDSLL